MQAWLILTTLDVRRYTIACWPNVWPRIQHSWPGLISHEDASISSTMAWCLRNLLNSIFLFDSLAEQLSQLIPSRASYGFPLVYTQRSMRLTGGCSDQAIAESVAGGRHQGLECGPASSPHAGACANRCQQLVARGWRGIIHAARRASFADYH